MNLIGIGKHVINLEQVTRFLKEEKSIIIFFANTVTVGPFGGSTQPDTLDQLRLLGEEAEAVTNYLNNGSFVKHLDKPFLKQKEVINPDQWESQNEFPK